MSGNPLVFNSVSLKLSNDTINLSSDTFYMELVTSVPAASSATRSNIASTTVPTAGSSYVAKQLTGKTVTTFGTGGSKLVFDDPIWTGLYANPQVTITGGIIIKGSTSAINPTDDLLCYLPILGGDHQPPLSVGSDLTLPFDPNGALTIEPV